MTLNEYQEKAAEFLIPGVPPEERVLGLLAEAGEVAGVFQKLIRGTYAPVEAEKLLFKELGDVLWYLSQVANDNGWDLAWHCSSQPGEAGKPSPAQRATNWNWR